MSKTKAVNDLVARAQNDLKGVTLSTPDALDFANEVYHTIGSATAWDWLITAGTTFGTVANQQDYANVPADLWRIKAAWVNDDSSTFTYKYPLAIRESLPQTNTRSIPNSISIENGNFRLYPMPIVTRSGSGQWAILFEYWKRHKRLAALTDTFEFDDIYFEVIAAGFTARTAEFVRYEQAGQWMGRDPNTGRFTGTGLWGKFAVMLNQMVFEEELESGVPIVAPADPLLRG